ncbi:MAG: HAMP domain-containing protein [Anaerolineae bacterium]|nr:HAMP domain-containing protein [Anaerolineae bacterium]
MLQRMPFAIKLSLTLGLTVLVAVGAVAVASNISAAREFEAYVVRGMGPSLAEIAPLLAAHYREAGSWAGVEVVLEEAVSLPGRGQGRGVRGLGMGGHLALILGDSEGRIVHATSEADRGQRLSARILALAQPIEVSGRVVGYLVSGTGQQERLFTERLDRSILSAGALAIVVATVLGLALTRTALRPLRQMSAAARRIASGQLSQRVAVASRDEIGDLGRAFNEMAAALERDEALRRKMMADVAHELRTPVAVMQAQVEALQDGVFELDQHNLAPIYAQTLLLGRLINDLRDLALAEAGQLPMEMAPLDPKALLERIGSAFRPRAQAKGLRLAIERPAELPSILGDAQRLEQVLGNLLDNAIRYTPEGGEIALRAWSDGGHVHVSVTDNGPGIAQADLEHLFERFYRADRARSRAEGGTGLGLSIARQIAQAHGGNLTVDSQEGRGSTFTLHLPNAESEGGSPA